MDKIIYLGVGKSPTGKQHILACALNPELVKLACPKCWRVVARKFNDTEVSYLSLAKYFVDMPYENFEWMYGNHRN